MEIESEDGPYALYKYLKDRAEEQTYTVRIELQRQTRNFRGELEREDKWMIVEGRATMDFRGTISPRSKRTAINGGYRVQGRKCKEQADSPISE